MDDLTGQRILMARRSRGWARFRLAQVSGVCPETIGRIERGETKRPRFNTMMALADALGLPAEELAHGGER